MQAGRRLTGPHELPYYIQLHVPSDRRFVIFIVRYIARFLALWSVSF